MRGKEDGWRRMGRRADEAGREGEEEGDRGILLCRNRYTCELM